CRLHRQSAKQTSISLRQAEPYDGPASVHDLRRSIARELLRAVEPMAIEAAFKADRMHREQQEEQQRILDLELRQARYEASLAERRYAPCIPDIRLIAAQREKNWEPALRPPPTDRKASRDRSRSECFC